MARIIKFLLASVLFSCGCIFLSYPRDGIYLIPKGYVGDVIVLFDQPDGISPKIENDLYVYEIPQDGILRLKTSAHSGVVSPQYYYVDASGQRQRLTNLRITGDRNRYGEPQNKFGNITQSEFENTVFVMATGGPAIVENATGRFSYTSFIVGTPKQSEKLYENMERRIDQLQMGILKIAK